MKAFIRRCCLMFSPLFLLTALCLLAIFVLPAQYDQTFPAALKDKIALLSAPTDHPRIIVVGGSSAAFGQRSDLLTEALPGWDAVNFGLYAGLGTTVMLDLALPEVRAGDIVILSPEQNQQTLSGYFGAKTMWQACDGDFSPLLHLSGDKRRAMVGQALSFAADKARLWFFGNPPTGDGIYGRDRFHVWGDLTNEGREVNVMPGGFDPNMPIVFDPALLEDDFVEAMNAFAHACHQKGAQVYYHFCPMNLSAIDKKELMRIDAYADALQSRLDFPLLGTAEESILAAGWFFDTNFHLNANGAILYTSRMAAQLRAVLGLSGEVDIPLPDMPALSFPGQQHADAEEFLSEDGLFRWVERDGTAFVTGLTQAALEHISLTLPETLGRLPVTAFAHDAFTGHKTLQELVLPTTLQRIDDRSFEGCRALKRVVLTQSSPSLTTVGNNLLAGTDCLLIVPAATYGQYQTNYFWSMYASRIRPDHVEATASAVASVTPSIVPVSTPAAPDFPLDHTRLYVSANGGQPLTGTESIVSFPLSRTHLRTNTPMGHALFHREGYAPLCWNTRADGTGAIIPFGSRTDLPGGSMLYMQWIPLSPENSFHWEAQDGHAVITGWTGSTSSLVIPNALDGLPVAVIASGAFCDAQLDTVVLPETLRVVEKGAFTRCQLHTLWLYDSLETINDRSLLDCMGLQTLFIHAATAPRYSISYFAAFADKMDWLRQVAQEKKLVIFGGSASRYGYSSPDLHKAFPAYQMVNMGVYAYTNALPQLRIIRQFMQPGDVLLSSPEFDTTETQFCPSNALDDCFWAMAEADYANASLLDLRQYTRVLKSLGDFLRNRQSMPPRQWEETPKHYDDDGNPSFQDTYNIYGDYTLLRSGGGRDGMLMYYRADYTVEAFPESLIESLNRIYREFQQQGVRVLFAYSPRNISSLTESSSLQQRQALDEHIRKHLCVPVILPMEDSLYPGTFFYLIDSHLNDEGLYLHNKRMIQALKEAGLNEE